MADYIVANSMEDVNGYYYAPIVLHVDVETVDGVDLITTSADGSEKSVNLFAFIAAVLATDKVREAMDNIVSVAEAEMQKRTYRLVTRGNEATIRQLYFNSTDDTFAMKYGELFSFDPYNMSTFVGHIGWNNFADEVVEILVAIRAGYIPVSEKVKTFLFNEEGELRSSKHFREYLDKKYKEKLEKLDEFRIDFTETELADREGEFDFSFIKNKT